MSSYYAKLAHLLSSWPGLGSVSSHRLLDAFMTKPYMKNNLEQIIKTLTEHPLCSGCQLPSLINAVCKNCQKESSSLIIFSKISDAMLFQYIHPNNEYQYFALKEVFDQKIGQSLTDIGLQALKRFAYKRSKLKKIIFISNQSVEAQATFFALKQLLADFSLYHPSWPNPKIPTLSGLSAQDIELLHRCLQEILINET